MQLPDGWKNLKLEEIACLKAGKFIPASQIKSQLDEVCVYPCFGGNGIRGYVSENSHKGLFPIIGRQGALCGNVNLATGRFYATEHAVVATSLNNNDSLWLYYALQFARLNQYATGQAQPGLSVDTINKIVFLVPPLAEQKKIAETLSVWDSAIEKMEKLIQSKNDLLAEYGSQLFGKKNCVRRGWENVCLSSVLIEHGDKSTGNEKVFSVSVHKGLVDQVEHLGRSFAAANTSNYNRAHYGDVIYTKSPTGNFPLGIVKQSLVKEDVIVSPLYGVFTPKTFELGVILDFYFSSATNANNYLHPIAQKGAKNTINITNTTFLSAKLNLPLDPKEQKNIADFIQTTRKEMSVLQDILENYKKQKQGLMQKLLTGEWRVK